MDLLDSSAQLAESHLKEYWMIYAHCPVSGHSLKVWDCKELSLFAGHNGRTLPISRLYVAVESLDRAGLWPLLAQLEALDPFQQRRLCVGPGHPL